MSEAQETKSIEVTESVEVNTPEPCWGCDGSGCSNCSDEAWYIAEDALWQERRDRAFDFAQRVND